MVTLAEPTAQMKKEAVAAGFHTIYGGKGENFPKVQIATVENLLCGKPPQLPAFKSLVFKRAKKEKPEQRGLL